MIFYFLFIRSIWSSINLKFKTSKYIYLSFIEKLSTHLTRISKSKAICSPAETHSSSFHVQSPLHHAAPFPWGHSEQVAAWWFPQLTVVPPPGVVAEESESKKNYLVASITVNTFLNCNNINQWCLSKYFHTTGGSGLTFAHSSCDFAIFVCLAIIIYRAASYNEYDIYVMDLRWRTSLNSSCKCLQTKKKLLITSDASVDVVTPTVI